MADIAELVSYWERVLKTKCEGESHLSGISDGDKKDLFAKVKEVRKMQMNDILKVCHTYADKDDVISKILYITCVCRWKELGLDTSYPGLHRGSKGCVIQ